MGEAINWLDGIKAKVEANRAIEVAKPLPRKTCPGCFLAIYEGAAKRGWCTDCWPRRKQYSASSDDRDANVSANPLERCREVDRQIGGLPVKFAMRWCEPGPMGCACLGCANGPEFGAGNLHAKGVTKEEWQAWKQWRLGG